jgi:hypothetical protein
VPDSDGTAYGVVLGLDTREDEDEEYREGDREEREKGKRWGWKRYYLSGAGLG